MSTVATSAQQTCHGHVRVDASHSGLLVDPTVADAIDEILHARTLAPR